jgi:hypothetical protein
VFKLKRHEAVLRFLGPNGKQRRQSPQTAKLRYVNFSEILARLPKDITTPNFTKRPCKTKKCALATIEYIYPLPDSHEISQDYVTRAVPVINKRLAQAGVRLAWILNGVLK